MNKVFKNISIIGSGYVGSSIAYSLMLNGYSENIILIDTNYEKSKSEVLDIRHGLPNIGVSNIICGDFSDIKDSDLIIITAGRNRQPNESRLNLINDNTKIIRSVTDEIKKYYTKGIILVVTNPVDILTYKISEWLGLNKEFVIGTGCILDVSRFISIIADNYQIDKNQINAKIIAEHGESQVALWSSLTISGIHINDYLLEKNIPFNDNIKQEIHKEVISMGTSIIKNKGRTHYGIATCVCFIINSILNNSNIITCVSCQIKGEYGINNVALSLPCIINEKGISKIIEEKIENNEYEKLILSSNIIKSELKSIK